MKKLFFNTVGRYTKAGIAVDMEVEKALKPIFEKYHKKGYSLREISHVILLETTHLESILILTESVKRSKRKRQAGVVE